MKPTPRRSLVLLACCLSLTAAVAVDWSYTPLTESQIARIRAAIADMKSQPRGPYLRIRWFCDDGTVHPPQPYACAERGGGHQYAEMRPEIAELGELGFHFGTILQALSEEEFVDRGNSGYRLRELVLHRFLEDIDDGWIMRRARFYRGARQAEDEERRGRELLVHLLADHEWRRANPLLASLLVETVPHGSQAIPGERMRDLATRIATSAEDFQPLRIKIHSTPGPDDRRSVRAWLDARGARLEPETRALVDELLAQMDEAYRVGIDAERWATLARSLGGTGLAGPAGTLAARLEPLSHRERIEILASFLVAGREELGTELEPGAAGGRQALALLETIRYAGAVLFNEAAQWISASPELSRIELLEVAGELAAATYGTGWLNAREYKALREALLDLAHDADARTRADYAQTVRYLAGAADWGTAGLLQSFGPVLERYAQVEPLVQRFPDEAVRGSLLLPFSTVMERLLTDASTELDTTHRFFDREVREGVLALNPGVAIGPMHVLDDLSRVENLDSQAIYVLPETPDNLGPVAGILTLDQGSRLSHVQLLARGLGIPNATISSSLLDLLRSQEGQTVVYAVSPAGTVLLVPGGDVAEAEAAQMRAATEATAGSLEIDARRLDLRERSVLPLSAVDVDDSGRIVGPKAANLGRLHGLFPDRVWPGLVIPFGVFRAHVDRDLDGDGRTLYEEIGDIFRRERRDLAAGEDPEVVRDQVLARLEEVRTRIRAMELLPEFRVQLEEALSETFGPSGSYGIFVRSDTNVEDLPNFSGAGLNLTVMNVIGTDAVLQAVRDVWASPFTPRSYLWRQRLLRNAEEVYPSIVLLKSVPSEASGVLVTADITGTTMVRGLDPGATWTVTLAQGVGGVVDGQAAETILVPADDTGTRAPILVSSARAIWKKRLVESGAGGIVRIPVAADETLLTEARLDDLRRVVREIVARYPRPRDATGPPQPWDIEFGFLADKTILFQIRPFVTNEADATLQMVEALDRRTYEAGRRPIDLGQRLTLTAENRP